MKELLISVASGIIVALVLNMFRIGGGESTPRHAVYAAPQPARRRSGGGGMFRFLLAVAGGLGLAFAAAPFVLGALQGERRGGIGALRARLEDYDGPRRWMFDSGYYDRGQDGIFGLPPLLVLTIVCTILVWVLLSAMTRR